MSLEWHKKVAARNTSAALNLFSQFDRLGVSYNRIVDIGAGIGTLIKSAESLGSKGIGFDVNRLTQPYARDVVGVDVRSEYWTPQTQCGDFDLMTCIMVLEHIEKPRPLLQDMVSSCISRDASLFISVPFLDKEKWHFIHEPDYRASGTPFFDNDMHVTHFSSKALESVLREFGMTSIEWIRNGLWHGPLARAR
ncbi:MAG: class I SAM-dependent methyltransferase [Paracoccaceae bacterium]